MDFRLKVFHTVASRLSFTKAASELFVSQPAVSKHIKELEEEVGAKLFDRDGNTITLTPAGAVFRDTTLPIFDIYRNVETEIAALSGEMSGTLRIGASTTVSQYILPEMLSLFKKRYPLINLEVKEGNTEDIENELLKKSIDIAIIEGHTRRTEISYTPLLKDELVLVCNSRNALVRKTILTRADLLQQKFVLREEGSGTLDVIRYALKQVSISLSDLQVEIRLNSTESIKSYLNHSQCVGLLSVHALHHELKNNELAIVDVEGVSMPRFFHIITLHGKSSVLTERFINFAISRK